MTIRLGKAVMLLGLLLFAFLVTFANITDHDSNFQFVRHVLSMDTTFEGNTAWYRSVAFPTLWHIGY
jgi:predicted small integral membrane protein